MSTAETQSRGIPETNVGTSSRLQSATSRLAPLAIVALVLAFFHKMAFSNLILARGDTFLYFYPYWQMAADALRAGHLPLWNPHVFMGAPFLANSQVGFFYPLNWPLWLLLPVPYAVSASILIHLVIAGWGAYLFGRRGLHLSPVAALLAALLFALGGYLTAQVEHINQLQGLAWLPWLFLAVQPVVGRPRRLDARWVWPLACLALAALFALQLLAGHTQSAFIGGVALSLWLLVHIVVGRADRRYVVELLGLVTVSVVVALLLAAIQLLPTLELTRYSARAGGLTLAEVLSFSWHPLLATRSLLPSYGQSLFSEYVAFLPLTALVLAVVGVRHWRRPAILGLVVLAIAGLVLALGRFTPVYWLLANLPGFDLFRVPARWLVLYGFSVSLLAGAGWDTLINQLRQKRSDLLRPVAVGLLLVLALMLWGFAAGLLAGIIPIGPEAPFEYPSLLTIAGWAVEIVLLLALLVALWRAPEARAPDVAAGLVVLAAVVLFLASRSLPYNNLTTPEAYFDIRPPAARLMALAGCEVPDEPCPTPPDRFLSLSDIFFDPGDQAEIDSIYVDQLNATARYDYTIAIKQKEIVAPNLPMIYDLFSVDGFDGGILPLRAYSELMQLLLPEGQTTEDGRLREYLPAVPEDRWLDLFNTRYLITDKVGDEWRQGVFFDRQFQVRLAEGETATVGYVPSFDADEIWLLSTTAPPVVSIGYSTGEQLELEAELLEAPDLYRVRLPRLAELEGISLRCSGPAADCGLAGVTLVDSGSGAFHALVPGPFQQIYSGDVKIYEYLAAQPRAWIVYDWQWLPDSAAGIAAMASPTFDPRQEAVVIGETLPTAGEGLGNGRVDVLRHEAESVALKVSTDRPGLVVLADAGYPGWRAMLNGKETPIHQTNGLFRGVFVPAGSHELVFTYESGPFRIGLWVTVLALGVGLLLAIVLLLTARRDRNTR